MLSIQIIVGSMLGGTEYVAEACEEVLTEAGHECQLHLTPDLGDIPHKNQIWLLCCSTHGAGDYPDNIQPFVKQLEENTIDLHTTQLLTIGVGDSNYDTFCHAAKNLNTLLISKGCKEIVAPFLLDMSQEIDPELDAQTWIRSNLDRLS